MQEVRIVLTAEGGPLTFKVRVTTNTIFQVTPVFGYLQAGESTQLSFKNLNPAVTHSPYFRMLN